MERPASIWFTDKNSYSSDDKSIDNLDADFGSTLQRSMKAHMNSVRKSFSQSEIFKPRICNNSYAEKFNQYFIQASRYCKIFLETNYARVFSTCLYIFASVVMCMQVSKIMTCYFKMQVNFSVTRPSVFTFFFKIIFMQLIFFLSRLY